MRKFALVILDIEDKILDRYNLDFVTAPQNLGYELTLSTIQGEVEDTVTKIDQKKLVISFTVNQYQYAYEKANALVFWMQGYSRPEYTMALEYDDGTIVRYCCGFGTMVDKNELDQSRNLPLKFNFTQTTPFFVKRDNTIKIQVSAKGKSYPFKYPYSYGRNLIENNEIDNKYIKDVPVIVTIDGAIDTTNGIWAIELVKENGDSYTPQQMVAFDENLPAGSQVIINSAQKKIYKKTNGVITDYKHHVSPLYDTYLRAGNGKSKLKVLNMITSTGTGFMVSGSWREYRL